jgi:hypothetical protein
MRKYGVIKIHHDTKKQLQIWFLILFIALIIIGASFIATVLILRFF